MRYLFAVLPLLICACGSDDAEEPAGAKDAGADDVAYDTEGWQLACGKPGDVGNGLGDVVELH